MADISDCWNSNSACRVLGRLAEHELFLRPEKCEFEKTRIEYLGLIISENHVEMDPVKVAEVAEWPEPTNRREVQSFLGFANLLGMTRSGGGGHPKQPPSGS